MEPSETGPEALARVLGALRPAIAVAGDGDATIGTGVFGPEPEHRGNPGWLHGGLAATVLDHLCARTAAAALDQRVVTGTLDLRYPQPVVLAEGPFALWAVADRPRGRMVRVRGVILGVDGRALVEAKALFVMLG